MFGSIIFCWTWQFLSPPVRMHSWLMCITFCPSVWPSVFTQGTLCTTTMVYGVLVHHQGAICTMVHKGDYIFQGQGSCGSRSKVKWVKPSLKVMVLVGGLTSTSSCFIYINFLVPGVWNRNHRIRNSVPTIPLYVWDPQLFLLGLLSPFKALLYKSCHDIHFPSPNSLHFPHGISTLSPLFPL